MDIGNRLKELRVLKGLTQEELADRSELSKGFISQLERNLTSPSIATLMDILQCLGTSIGEFFTEELHYFFRTILKTKRFTFFIINGDCAAKCIQNSFSYAIHSVVPFLEINFCTVFLSVLIIPYFFIMCVV